MHAEIMNVLGYIAIAMLSFLLALRLYIEWLDSK